MTNLYIFPFFFSESVDVNLTPDKRKILIQEEKTLLAIIKVCEQGNDQGVQGCGGVGSNQVKLHKFMNIVK